MPEEANDESEFLLNLENTENIETRNKNTQASSAGKKRWRKETENKRTDKQVQMLARMRSKYR